MAKSMIAIHKDSTKYVQAQVNQGDEFAFLDAALAQIRRDMNDSTSAPEITEDRIVVLEIEGSFKILKATQMNFLKNPPSSQPAQVVTHGR